MTLIFFLSLRSIPLFQTVERNNRSSMGVTPLRTNENYIVYYNFWTKTMLTELLPYVLLVFFNVSIYRAIRRSLELQKSMRCTSSQQEEIKSANVVVRKSTQMCGILENSELRETQTERGNSRGSATKVRRFSRPSCSRNIHH